jgi:alcohol dehydrogenase
MKAVYFMEHGSADVLRYGDLPEPELRTGWVKIRVRACALNHLDIFSRNGMPGIKIAFPHITGADCAGEIAEVGPRVDSWAVGQRVLVYPPHLDYEGGKVEIMGENRPGALAEYCTARASQLVAIPDHVTDEDAAALPTAYGTAHRMLCVRTIIQPGQTVLILGASGGVGNAAVLLAKMAGARVLAAAGSAEKCERLKQIGADETIDYSAEPFDSYVRRTTGSLLRGGGYDVVVNFTGGPTWAPSLRCVKRHGRLLTCGATAGYDPPTDIRYIYMGELTIIGSTGWEISDQQSILGMVAGGKLRPVIGAVLPLHQGIEAYRLLEDRNFFGKIIVKP